MNVAERLRNEYKSQFIAEGMQQVIETVARNMLNEGAEIDFVAKTTGLTKVQIQIIKECV